LLADKVVKAEELWASVENNPYMALSVAKR
jgi:hypothetical protein